MTKWKRASTGFRLGAIRCLPVLGLAAACGGPSKPADAPGSCPPGTVLRGSDCVPPEAANDAPTEGESSSPRTSRKSPADQATKSPSEEDKFDDHPASAGASSDTPADVKTPYDRDAVEAELKRGARQVKANCGAATDDDGQATGPWGRTKASIALGRNGHVKQVTVPQPFDGKPVGLCITHAFDKIQFPPYASPSDITIDWDVDVVQPKH